MNREDKFTYIPWEFANPKKRWRLKTQKTLDDFMVSSDFLETTKRGAKDLWGQSLTLVTRYNEPLKKRLLCENSGA